jgi:hypothetical protein
MEWFVVARWGGVLARTHQEVKANADHMSNSKAFDMAVRMGKI